MLDRYLAQVRLLVDVLPNVAAESAFALKGGTAINLFCRDMPRLSVDIDLTWLLIGDRSSSLGKSIAHSTASSFRSSDATPGLPRGV